MCKAVSPINVLASINSGKLLATPLLRVVLCFMSKIRLGLGEFVVHSYPNCWVNRRRHQPVEGQITTDNYLGTEAEDNGTAKWGPHLIGPGY
jgi:hypothetical protein